MKALLIIFSLLLVLLLVGLWVGPGSYPDRWRTGDRALALESSNESKKEKIKKIRAELNDAASSTAAIEERARSELGMTKKNETFFEVILQKKNKPVKSKAIKNTDDSTVTKEHSKSD